MGFITLGDVKDHTSVRIITLRIQYAQTSSTLRLEQYSTWPSYSPVREHVHSIYARTDVVATTFFSWTHTTQPIQRLRATYIASLAGPHTDKGLKVHLKSVNTGLIRFYFQIWHANVLSLVACMKTAGFRRPRALRCSVRA